MNKLLNVLKKNKVKKVFLVSGRNSYKKSGAQQYVERQLSSFSVVRFSTSGTNPKIENIKEGLRVFDKHLIDAVVAVGGGTVIDTAKAINSLAHQVGKMDDYVVGKKKISISGKPLIAIPTTAGSGSEATKFAVIYMGKKKYSIDHDYLLPNHALLEPKLTLSLSRQMTAITGIDAFCQAIESYWSVSANKQSRDYSKKAIGLILKHLPKVYNNPKSVTSRKAMLLASNLAGKAINITRTTASHALSYAMTSHFGIPHGQAVAVTLGRFMAYNSKYAARPIKDICKMVGVNNVEDAEGVINNFMLSLGLKTKISELDLEKRDIDLIVKNVNINRLKNNPGRLNKKDLKNILLSIY